MYEYGPIFTDSCPYRELQVGASRFCSKFRETNEYLLSTAIL